MFSHAFAAGALLGTAISPLVCVSAAERSPVAAAEDVVARVTPSAKGATRSLFPVLPEVSGWRRQMCAAWWRVMDGI